MAEYKGLKGTLERLTITDAQAQKQIEQLIEQHPRLIPVTDRPSRLDDEVVLDYAGYVDGEQFEGGTAQMQTLVLGSGMFIPGFEDQLVGKRPGDQVDVHVTFPAQYHAPDLAWAFSSMWAASWSMVTPFSRQICWRTWATLSSSASMCSAWAT